MKKVLLQTLIGLLFLGVGLVATYISLEGLRSGGSPILLIIGVISILVGLFIMYKAGRLDAFKPKIAEVTLEPQVNKGNTILEKNNKIISEWNETNQKRDKLKMLEAAGSINEETSLK